MWGYPRQPDVHLKHYPYRVWRVHRYLARLSIESNPRDAALACQESASNSFPCAMEQALRHRGQAKTTDSSFAPHPNLIYTLTLPHLLEEISGRSLSFFSLIEAHEEFLLGNKCLLKHKNQHSKLLPNLESSSISTVLLCSA